MASHQNTGQMLACIARRELSDAADIANNNEATIKNCEYFSSYNIVESSPPSLIVPGSPARWTPNGGRQQKCLPDNGTFYRDDNAARFTSSPSAPLVLAVRREHPDFDPDTIDIVACGNTLGHCLNYALDPTIQLRFSAQLVGKTLFLVRTEKTGKETIPGIRGYGHSFLEDNTQWDAEVRGSVSHQRIVKYDFGGMTLLVRSESDGYLPSKATGSKATPASSSNPPPTLSELIAATKIGTAAIQASKDTDAAIKITPSDTQIPQTAIFDLKTRAAYGYSQIDMHTILPRLWANQTPNFIIAYHRDGWFKAAETRIKDVRKDVDRWEKRHGKALAVMGGLLKALVKAAGGASDGRIAVGTGRDGQLEVYEPADLLWTVLPPDLIAAWTKGAEEDGDEGDGDRDGDGDSEDDEVDGGHGPDLDDEAEEYARLFDHAADGDDGRGDESSGQDFTACSAEDCGYCGHCRH